MTVVVVVAPNGPKATPEGIEAWKRSAQAAADEQDAELELIARRLDGSIEAHIIASPGDEPIEEPA